MRTNERRSGGLLVELLVASAIFIVITQVFFALNRQKMITVRMAEHRTIAARAADREIDRLRALPAQDIDRADGREFAVHGLSAGDAAPGRIRVEAVEGHPDLRRVTATVDWEGEPGRAQRLSISAVVRPRSAR